MEQVNIRRIKITDSMDIQILNEELGHPCSFEKVRDRIQYITENLDDIIFVAQMDQEVIGYIHGSPYELLYADSLINIMAFVVKEKYRNLGIGGKLLESFEEYVKTERYAGIRLVSRFERIDAHRFYENHGYINRKDQKNFIKLFDR
jgi:predicted N-acetyltransferase YhbS